MKKTVTIGLITLGLGGAAYAQTAFTNVDGNLWKTAANWDDSNAGTSDDTPTSSINASITAGHNAVIDTNYDADAKKLTMNGSGTTGSSLTIQANGSLTLSDKLLQGRYSTVWNNGTLGINSTIGMNSPGAQFFNSGTITATNLLIQNNGVFNMQGGSFTSTGKLLVAGGTATQVRGILNIHGGTTEFIDTDWFDSSNLNSEWQAGDYTIDFEGAGTLVFNLSGDATRYGNLKTIVGNAITDGWITTDGVKFADGGGASVVYNDTAKTITLTAIPEPGTYALLAGCFGLTWVMLRRRR